MAPSIQNAFSVKLVSFTPHERLSPSDLPSGSVKAEAAQFQQVLLLIYPHVQSVRACVDGEDISICLSPILADPRTPTGLVFWV